MNLTLIVHPFAGEEIAFARSWYEDISTDLGNDFALCVTESLELIQHNPRLYADSGDGLRRAIIRRFPYHVFYRIGRNRINVLAVFHSHADRRNVVRQAFSREARQ